MFKTVLIVYSKDGKKIHSAKSMRNSLRSAKVDANAFWKSIRANVPKTIEVTKDGERMFYLDNFEKLEFKLPDNE